MLSLSVYTGDLGLNSGAPKSVYTLDTSGMAKIAGPDTPVVALKLKPGERVPLPNGLGSVELSGVKRFASFDITHDPTKAFMLFFAVTILVALGAAFFIPRRRIWVCATQRNSNELVIEYGGLSRGDDARLDDVVSTIVRLHTADLVASSFSHTNDPLNGKAQL